jgi:hypothetical protein
LLLILQVQQHAGLRERHIGLLQGLTNKEAPFKQPEAWAALQSGDHSARLPGGGESLDDLKQRLAETLLDIAAQHQGKRVLVISHGGALHATHRAARGYEAQGKVSNCSISVVTAELDSQPDSCQDLQDQHQAQPDSCQDQRNRESDLQDWLGSSSGSSSSSSEDVVMQSSVPHSDSLQGCAVDTDSSSDTVQQLDATAVEQLGSGLGLLFSSTASQGSGYCSSSCCGCCYCMGDVGEMGCIGNVGYNVACDDDVECQGREGLERQGDVLVLHPDFERLQQQCAAAAATAQNGSAEQTVSEVAAAAAKAAVGGSGKAWSGKLSMLVWNDTAALFDLQAEEGVGMTAAGFGGCAREA